jgi:hypothetical protein
MALGQFVLAIILRFSAAACYFYLLTMPITKRCVREFSGSLEESQALLGMSSNKALHALFPCLGIHAI